MTYFRLQKITQIFFPNLSFCLVLQMQILAIHLIYLYISEVCLYICERKQTYE